MEKNIFDYKIEKTDKDTFFIGANSEKGFVYADKSLFDESGYDRVFVLKGSSGGGKSTFIRKAEKLAEKSGHKLTEYRCSSDPYSADAAVFETDSGKYLIVDGTAPHVIDAKFPVACSEYIDLTAVTSKEKLEGKREEIIELTEMKKKAFDRAYSYLLSAHDMSDAEYELTKKVTRCDKLDSTVSRFISKSKYIRGSKRCEYITCISMKGMVMLDTYLRRAKSIYVLDGCMGIENVFMDRCVKALEKCRASFAVCPCPYDSSLIDAVYIDSCDTLVIKNTACPVNAKRINMRRFVGENIKECRGEYRFIQRCRCELIKGACTSLESAEKVHFSIEDIYKNASDYSVSNKLFNKTVSKYIKSFTK